MSEIDRIIARYAALAVVIHILEAALPSPVPGIKPGLANVVTLIVMARFGLPAACWVALLRVLVGSLLLGSFLTPTFILSFSGALCALGALSLGQAWNTLAARAPLSCVGLGMLASCAHMAGQFLVAWSIFIPHPGLLVLLPILMSAALLFGLATGWLSQAALSRMPPVALAGRDTEAGY